MASRKALWGDRLWELDELCCGRCVCDQAMAKVPMAQTAKAWICAGIVCLPKLPILALQGLHPGGHVRCQARLAPGVDIDPLHPLIERLRRTADLAAIDTTAAQREA